MATEAANNGMTAQFLALLLAVTPIACTTAKHSTQDTRSSERTMPVEPIRTSDTILLAAAVPLSGIETPTTKHSENLWDTIRAGFSIPQQDNQRIRSQRNWYAKHHAYMDRVTQRMQPYLWYIIQQLQLRNMPTEIALLPIVESAYDPFAYSHGRAAGLWQFIPATGKYYGLKQNWWYDGRRDIVDSTRAALDYLQHLHKRFDGDWLLALAAYNSGEGTVLKARRKHRKAGKPTDFWNLELPRETRAYVPKLLALAQLVHAPEAVGSTLQSIPNQPQFTIIDTGGQMDLAVAADLAGISLDELYRLNPGYNQWATNPDGPHRLLIPMEKQSVFMTGLASLPVEQRIQWVRHKIRSGETLGHIAQKYQTTTASLKANNDLRNNSIRAGKHLMVPVASEGREHYRLSKNQRETRKKNVTRKGVRSKHTVRNGDTLWDLSRLYKVNVRKLASWNSMAPGDTLKVGQKLAIWSAHATTSSAHPGARIRPIHYTVRNGDSLSRISQRFKVTLADLRKWNSLGKKRYIQPGQKLKLYVDVTRQAGSS